MKIRKLYNLMFFIYILLFIVLARQLDDCILILFYLSWLIGGFCLFCKWDDYLDKLDGIDWDKIRYRNSDKNR